MRLNNFKNYKQVINILAQKGSYIVKVNWSKFSSDDEPFTDGKGSS